MRMREHTLFLRLSTRRDLAALGELPECVAAIERLVGEEFESIHDLSAPRTEPSALRPDRRLSMLVAPGAHVRLRYRLTPGPNATRLRALEINAAAHPYSGAHVTQLDLRVSESFLDNDGSREAFVSFFRESAERAEATWAYAHLTDDNAIQNATSAAMLRLGYGVELEQDALSDLPGREVSRGEFRYAPEWLVWLGASMIERLSTFSSLDAPVAEKTGASVFARLAEHPRELCDEDGRLRQREFRAAMGFDDAARADRWTQGYYERRSTRHA